MRSTNNIVGLDFETYAPTDLPKAGLDNYVNDPNFRVLLAAVVHKDWGTVIDFTEETYDEKILELDALLGSNRIAAHNAAFEMAVLKKLGIPRSIEMIDTAVLSRAYGCGSSLEAAAPQVLGVDKMPSGLRLIKKFSIPGEYQEGTPAFDPTIVADNPSDWAEFKDYCELDARLSLDLAYRLMPWIDEKEMNYWQLTHSMNVEGWPVDLELVTQLYMRYKSNTEAIEQSFSDQVDEDINLRSHKQKQEWCRERGVRISSFDEKSVAKYLPKVVGKRDQYPVHSSNWNAYNDVVQLLLALQQLGGSSVKKLDKILATTGQDGRLRDQYLHLGAQATYRTTGRGVQMQNLPRLYGEGDSVEGADMWSNTMIGHNLRQCFKASHPEGRLIVGDFSSVESRGLAWLAGEQWKLDEYAIGMDIYKVLAAKFYGKPVGDITKSERTFGKVGELACGYGAGAGAVKDFAEGMGVMLTEAEAKSLVNDWRDANPETVLFWRNIDAVLHRALALNLEQQYDASENAMVKVVPVLAPESLRKQHGDDKLQSLWYEVHERMSGRMLLRRVIHGVHQEDGLVYYKPSERKTGDLWAKTYIHPKTGRPTPFTLYGGKMAGLLTQSLCREIFFETLDIVSGGFQGASNVRIIGQFHDEIVLEWEPDAGWRLPMVATRLEQDMQQHGPIGFPMAAEVHAAPRYIK